jgi:hypothetical protein
VFILQCKKKGKKQLPKYLKIAETRVVLYDINGALCEVRAYSATVSIVITGLFKGTQLE